MPFRDTSRTAARVVEMDIDPDSHTKDEHVLMDIVDSDIWLFERFEFLIYVFARFLSTRKEFYSTTEHHNPDQYGWARGTAFIGDTFWNTQVVMVIKMFADEQKIPLGSLPQWGTARKSTGVSNKLMEALGKYLYITHFPRLTPSWSNEHFWGTAFEAFFLEFQIAHPDYASALVKCVCSQIFPPSTAHLKDQRDMTRFLDHFISRLCIPDDMEL